jgi:hypothetical protein
VKVEGSDDVEVGYGYYKERDVAEEVFPSVFFDKPNFDEEIEDKHYACEELETHVDGVVGECNTAKC